MGTSHANDATNQSAGLTSPGRTSLRDLLASYDQDLVAVMNQVLSADSGEERVRLLHQASRFVAVHDAVVRHALCPMLRDLPGGDDVAERLCRGCDERADLLARFDALTKGVVAHNVYPASGPEIEEIVGALERSLSRHVYDETDQVGTVLESAGESVDPDVVAAAMAIEAQRAPTRVHRGAAGGSRARTGIYRVRDRVADWNDAHHGWRGRASGRVSPDVQATDLERGAGEQDPSVRDVLAGYDATVAALASAWEAADAGPERDEQARRLHAAITVHDSVIGGVLCPLLESVPEGRPVAEELRTGTQERADLYQRWSALLRARPTDRASGEGAAEIESATRARVESFRAHEQVETDQVLTIMEHLADEDYRTWTSMFNDIMWPWRSEGPELLAIRMAQWAKRAPARSHPLLARHPESKTLRSAFHVVDYWRGFRSESALGRWAAPPDAPAPFAQQQRGSRSESGTGRS